MFKSRIDYKKHVQTHNKEPENVQCDWCDFRGGQTIVDYHKRMKHAHNNTVEANGYKCHLCSKAIDQKWTFFAKILANYIA